MNTLAATKTLSSAIAALDRSKAWDVSLAVVTGHHAGFGMYQMGEIQTERFADIWDFEGLLRAYGNDYDLDEVVEFEDADGRTYDQNDFTIFRFPEPNGPQGYSLQAIRFAAVEE